MKTRVIPIRRLVVHTQSGPLRSTKTRVMLRVMLAQLNASYAMQENPPLQKTWSSGLTVTGAENGRTHTVLWVPTQPLVGLFVHRVAI